MRPKKSLWWIPLIPSLLIVLGAFLNILAVTVNKGYMPVVIPAGWGSFAPGAIVDARHVSWSSDVHLAFLCDWIQWFDSSVCSPGDMLLFLGDFLQIPVLCFWAAINLFKEA